MLELEHVRKYYESPGEVIRAVEDITMTVRSSEFIALLGPSGSGKTTLLLLAAGLLRADAGSIRFEGCELGALSRNEMRAHRRAALGFVFQDFRLAAGLSAQENVALPLLTRGVKHRDALKRAASVLAEVGLADRLQHAPDRISGGEQQRVAIARALVGGPKLILADEPTGNLDSDTSEAMLQILSTLPREHGAAAMMVTHDARLAGYADRVLGMRDGRLTEPDLEAQTALSE
jgi:putative ABC transport system ATP-binding protein